MGLERLDRWCDQLEMKKQYFGQRKNWARSFAEQNGLANPGDSAVGMFYARTYQVIIGPRGGLNIHGQLPWQDSNGWRWFEKTPKQRKRAEREE